MPRSAASREYVSPRASSAMAIPPEAVPVRLHRSGIAAAAIGGGASIQATLRRIGEAGAGGLVYLRDGAAGGP